MSDNVEKVVIEAITTISERTPNINDKVSDFLDSLERVEAAMEITDTYTNAELMEEPDYFSAITVSDMIAAVRASVNKSHKS